MFIIRCVSCNQIHALGVAISSRQEALGCSFVLIAAPLGIEDCELSVFRVYGYTMVSVPLV